jgi:hypothetical protein
MSGELVGGLTGRFFARRFFSREDVQFILHGLALLALLVLLRPMFTAIVPATVYEARTLVWELIKLDITVLTTAAQGQRPAVPHLLFLVIPTVLILASGRPIRWSRWESGASLRAFVMTLLLMMAWAGSTFDYNLYLNQGHAWDRLLLIALTALSWRSPLAVPFATRWALILIKEAYVPLALDDFDFRPVHEILVVFSCFVWASPRRTFNTRHFLLVGLACWASYYFVAGIAKMFFGPAWSWLLENHVTNLAIGGRARGWLGFISDETFMGAIAFIRRFDVLLAGFVLVVELGALALFFVHPRVTRLWLWLCIVLHAGIFILAGAFFWKWILADIAFLMFLRRGGEPILRRICRQKAVIVFAILMVTLSGHRIYFYPQTGVRWYDSGFVENWMLYAVGPSGARYLVDPSTMGPMEMHWTHGNTCYATEETSITSEYGVTGSYGVMKAIEGLKAPEDALKVLARGRPCKNPGMQNVFNEFMRRYFGTMNRQGKPYGWLSWIERPAHLWVQPQGDLYELEEPVERIELWREIVVHHGGALHRVETKKTHEVAIPR